MVDFFLLKINIQDWPLFPFAQPKVLWTASARKKIRKIGGFSDYQLVKQ